jgi:hypothetical protein
LLIIFIPIALVIGSSDERRKGKVADRFPCTNYGHIIGAPAIDLADIKQREQIDRLQHEHPDLKPRLTLRNIQAICTRCGTNFKYLEKDKIFNSIERRYEAEDGISFESRE